PMAQRWAENAGKPGESVPVPEWHGSRTREPQPKAGGMMALLRNPTSSALSGVLARALCGPLALLAMAPACSDGGGGGPIAVHQGPHDNAENERVSVDEAALVADIEGDAVRVEVPVASVSGAPASGNLTVRLIGVDGKNEVARTTLPYDVPGAGTQDRKST